MHPNGRTTKVLASMVLTVMLSSSTPLLYVINADGSVLKQLTSADNTDDWSPDWSRS